MKIHRRSKGGSGSRHIRINGPKSAISETTAASTLGYVVKEYNIFRQDIPNELEDDLFAESKDSKLDKEEGYVGEKAYKTYYKKYKKYSLNPNRYEESPMLAFMKECRQLHIPPSPFGLIKRENKGKENEINIKSYNIGDNYAKALSSSIKHMKTKAINLCNNNNTVGIMNIINNLNDQGERIDLSSNFANGQTITMICSWLTKSTINGRSNLKYLNLSNNRLKEGLVLTLGRGLRSSHPYLKELNLSKNMMGDLSSCVLGEYLARTMTLEILDLSWNQITSYGGTKIFEGIKEGRSGRSVNISYNLLGKLNSFSFVEAVQLVVSEGWLKHLDLSFNRMKRNICEKLGMLIMDDHTLYGIHMEGNEGYVDKFGFIQVESKTKSGEHAKHTIIYPRSSNGFSTTIKFSKISKKFRPKVNCWVCEGWTESTFSFKLGVSHHEIEEPVQIHFDYNFYKPELMRPLNDSEYTITTMGPPGKIKYFFTLDKIAVQAKDHPRTSEKIYNAGVINGIEMYDEIKSYKIKRFNYRMIDQGNVLDDGYRSLLKECMPRLRQLKYRKQIQYRIKEEWTVTKSVFSDYIADSDELMNKIFEADWEKIQRPLFKDGMEDKVKAELKKGYWNIRDAFKYYSSISSSTGSVTFALTLNSYTDYLKQAGVYKEKTILISETDTLFWTTNKRDKPTTLNPGNALIRHQFLEIILRIAIKYLKKGNPDESVRHFGKEVVETSLKNGKSQDFRENRYWNEYGDNVYRFHMHLLKEIYTNYSGAVTKPGEEKFMSPGEFEKIFLNANLLNERFANRDIYVCYNLAMQARIDELSSDAHLRMTFIEFMEALARASDYLSLAPPSDRIRDLYLHEIYSEIQVKEETDKMKEQEEKSRLLQENEDEDDDEHKETDLNVLEDAEGADMTELEHINQPLHK